MRDNVPEHLDLMLSIPHRGGLTSPLPNGSIASRAVQHPTRIRLGTPDPPARFAIRAAKQDVEMMIVHTERDYLDPIERKRGDHRVADKLPLRAVKVDGRGFQQVP
jgi:hypothetical protein